MTAVDQRTSGLHLVATDIKRANLVGESFRSGRKGNIRKEPNQRLLTLVLLLLAICSGLLKVIGRVAINCSLSTYELLQSVVVTSRRGSRYHSVRRRFRTNSFSSFDLAISEVVVSCKIRARAYFADSSAKSASISWLFANAILSLRPIADSKE